MRKFTIESIKHLKGAPLAVLLLLFFCAEPVSQAWLERWSGYSNKTIAQACHLLKECCLVVCTLDGWVLADQVILPPHPRRNSIPIINITDSDSINPENESTNTEPWKNSTPENDDYSPPTANLPPESPEKTEMWQILVEAGIHRNDRIRALLKKPHMNPAYLRAKLEDYKAREKDNPGWLGLVIQGMEEAEPSDPRAPNGHRMDCQCSKCAFRHFTTGR